MSTADNDERDELERAALTHMQLLAIAAQDEDDERPPLEFPNELARRAARGLGASTHKPPADDPAPS
jgi:hypothetical protein